MSLCLWCLKEKSPKKRRGGNRKIFCSDKCEQASRRDLNKFHHNVRHKNYMRVWRKRRKKLAAL